jgi:hypothetical protein
MSTLATFIPYAFAGGSLVILLVAIWSRRWPRTRGMIEVSIFDREWEAESSGSKFALEKKGKFYLAYSYSVGGIAFQGSRLAPLAEFDWQVSGSADLGSAHDRAGRYREGATVEVSYCPFLPRWSCLEPGGYVSAFVFGAVAALLFVVI